MSGSESQVEEYHDPIDFLLDKTSGRSIHQARRGRTEPELNARIHKLNTRSSEQALVAFVSKKAEIDAMLTRLQALSDDHFNYSRMM
jgi:hypothetical protein